MKFCPIKLETRFPAYTICFLPRESGPIAYLQHLVANFAYAIFVTVVGCICMLLQLFAFAAMTWSNAYTFYYIFIYKILNIMINFLNGAQNNT